MEENNVKYSVEVKNANKCYLVGDQIINANKDLNFRIKEGEFVVIVGPSGAGKTTLLNLLGCMDTPTMYKPVVVKKKNKYVMKDGEPFNSYIKINGEDISRFNDRELTRFRRNNIGFVFQFYNLMPNLTAYDNVEIAAELVSEPLSSQKVLEEVGLNERSENFPSQLSGGEQQRVSIARAIAKNPVLLLCDEPTGALDYQTGKKILSLLHRVCKEHNKTVIIVTHNLALVQMADHVLHIKNGTIDSEEYNDNPLPIEEIEW